MSITLNNDTIVEENAAIGTLIGILTTEDEDIINRGNTANDIIDRHTYTFSGDNDVPFTLSNDTLKTSQIFDFETKANYEVTITTTDLGGNALEKTFTIEIIDVNDRPTMISLSDHRIAENKNAGTEIGMLSTADQDDTTHTYTISGNDSSVYQIMGNRLLTKATFDREQVSEHILTITTDDGNDNGSYQQNFTINILDENETPSAIMLSNDTVKENIAIGSIVGIFTTMDADNGDTHTYKIGGTDGGSFSIIKAENQLQTLAQFNYEEKSTYEIEITSTDRGGLLVSASFTLTIENSNDTPTDIMLTNTIISNENIGEIIGELTTTDEDKNDKHEYRISGTDASYFDIVENDLKIAHQLDNNQSRYTFSITSTDQDDAEFTKDFVITKESDEPITITLSHNTIKENQGVGTTVGILTTDNTNTNNTYILGGTDASAFSIVINTLKTAKRFDYETKSTYRITITTSDGKRGVLSQDFTIEVTDIDEADNTLSIDELSESVEILPVIVKDVFTLTIEHPIKGEVKVRLYALNGAIVKTENYHKIRSVLSKNIAVSHLPRGVYVVNIHFENFIITRKIVKN